MTTRIINVSPHLLMDVIACSSKAWTRHVKGMTSPGEAIEAVAGQAFHAGIATFLAPDAVESNPYPQERRAADAIEEFHRVYDPAYARLDAAKLEPSLTPANLHHVLARWIEMHPPAAVEWRRVLMVEEAFVSRAWDFDNVRVRLIVRPDAVVEDRFGMLRWLDTKTTGWHINDAGWQQDLKLSFQAQLYSDAMVQRYGERAIYGGWFSAIELRQLPSASNRKCTWPEHRGATYAVCGKEHAKSAFVECLTTPERVQRSVLDAENAAKRFVKMVLEAESGELDSATIMGLGMEGNAKGVCRFCPGANWCEAGRPTGENVLEGFFLHDPYPVEVGQR